MPTSDKSGEYVARAHFHFSSHSVRPGETVKLSHADAVRAIEQGTVEPPHKILTLAEFTAKAVAEADSEYPRYVAWRQQQIDEENSEADRQETTVASQDPIATETTTATPDLSGAPGAEASTDAVPKVAEKGAPQKRR